MLTALVLAVLQAGSVSTFVDAKSKEELLLLEYDGKLEVFYASKAGRKRQVLQVSGDVAGRIVQVTFPDPKKKYVLEWTAAHDHLKCANPDGTQQTFDRSDVERPPFQTPAAAVRALYAAYPPEGQLTRSLNFVTVEPAERAAFLAPKLAEALSAERAACQPGTECAPDFDVLYDAQDASIANLKVSEADKANVVKVTFTNFDQKTAIKLKTERTDQGWKVSDIVYAQGGSLAEILSASSKSRASK
ncbi:MAG: DUF3828 domain-containing protein [Myxococcaceae bacterium]